MAAILFFFALLGGFEIFMKNRLAYGAFIAGLDLGGLPISQAEKILNEKIAQYEKTDLIFIVKAGADKTAGENKEKTFQKTPAELGVKFDAVATLAKPANPFWARLAFITQIETLASPREIPLKFSFDEKRLDDFFNVISQTADQPPQNAAFAYDAEKKELIINEGKNGIAIDKKKFRSGVAADLSGLKNENIILQFSEQAPAISAADLLAIKPTAQTLIDAAPFVLSAGDWRGQIGAATLSQWLTAIRVENNLKLEADKEKISDFLKKQSPQINQKPIDAKLAWNGEKVTAFSLSQPGRQMEFDASAQKIYDGLLAGQKEINLVYETIEPKITTASVDMLGLTNLLGRGESNFAGSPGNRQHNIGVGAAKLNGLLVEPGAEFSFVDSIGEIDGTTGYLLGLVIKPGKTIEEYGGGICQVSTTLFRAAVKAGLKIIARSPHAIPIAYYNPPGFDATVYPPKPDLKFINDTPNKILLQAKISGTKLIFEIYGTTDGRQVKIIGPKTLVTNPDGSMKTILTQQIWRNGALTREDVFRSSYKSPNLYPITTPTPNP